MNKTPWVILTGCEPSRAFCERCGESYTLKFPMEIWELGVLAEGFTKKHEDCKVGPEGLYCATCSKTGHTPEACTMPPGTTPARWRAGNDTGTSSCTIYGALMGYGYLSNTEDVPYDGGDFGRCYRLVKLFPEWKARLPEVAAKHSMWAPFVREWDALTALYERDSGGRATELNLRIRNLVEEGRRSR